MQADSSHVCERRVERAPLLSGRSSRRGGYQPGSEILLGLACLRGRKTAAFSARSARANKQGLRASGRAGAAAVWTIKQATAGISPERAFVRVAANAAQRPKMTACGTDAVIRVPSGLRSTVLDGSGPSMHGPW